MLAQLERLLACPRCHGALNVDGATLLCGNAECGFKGALTEGIVDVLGSDDRTFFDHRYRVMMHGSDQPGAYAAFYAQQIAALQDRLSASRTIVDIGCGPRLVYLRPSGSVVIGVDPSFESLRHIRDVDVRIYGSATSLPLPSASVDAIVCFYSLHHFVGDRIAENERLIRTAFREFSRVLAPGGHLLVFEVAPWRPASAVQRVIWNFARRRAPEVVVMFFWSPSELKGIAAEHLPGATLEYQTFRVPPLTWFPPMFALQRVRLPRAIYPFEVCMYHWRKDTKLTEPMPEARTG